MRAADRQPPRPASPPKARKPAPSPKIQKKMKKALAKGGEK